MLVGTDVCVPVVLVQEKTGVPGGNPPVWLVVWPSHNGERRALCQPDSHMYLNTYYKLALHII